MLAPSKYVFELLSIGDPSDPGRGRGFTVSIPVPELFEVNARVADANECVSDSIYVNV